MVEKGRLPNMVRFKVMSGTFFLKKNRIRVKNSINKERLRKLRPRNKLATPGNNLLPSKASILEINSNKCFALTFIFFLCLTKVLVRLA